MFSILKRNNKAILHSIPVVCCVIAALLSLLNQLSFIADNVRVISAKVVMLSTTLSAIS